MSNQIKHENNITNEEALSQLKSMRFSGMAEAYRLQLNDPNSNILSFEERFHQLVSAEWTLRYNKKFARYLKQSGIKMTEASFDDTLFDPARKLNTHIIEILNTCTWIDEGKNLLITGMTGAGKSYYASALGIAALKQFKSVRYIKSSRLLLELDALRKTDDSKNIISLIEEYSKVDLLILDDFGLMDLDLEKCRDLFEILDSREGRKSTIVISQIPVKEWYDLFKESTYADACLDRLLYKAYRLEFMGESLRKRH